MNTQGTFRAAFAISLTGGVLMVLGATMMWGWLIFGGSSSGGMMGGMVSGFGGMMEGFEDMMGGFGIHSDLMTSFSVIGVMSGIIVIVGAIMLNTHPLQHTTWGTLILVFSIISFLGMGGFYLGAILGIAGGALTLSFSPTNRR